MRVVGTYRYKSFLVLMAAKQDFGLDPKLTHGQPSNIIALGNFIWSFIKLSQAQNLVDNTGHYSTRDLISHIYEIVS